MKLITLTLLAAALWAQEATPPPPAANPTRPVTRVIEFILDDGEKMQKLAQLFAHKLNRIQVEPALGLVVLTGPQAEVTEVEAAIKRYYKPKPLEAGFGGPPNRNFELTFHVLQGRNEGNENAGIPTALGPAIQQLRAVSNLTSFRSLESQILRVRDGEKIGVTGLLNFSPSGESDSPRYDLSGKVHSKGAMIQVDDFRFQTRILAPSSSPANRNYYEVAIYSSIDLKPGQVTVIGKTNASPKDGALILVLTAKLVD